MKGKAFEVTICTIGFIIVAATTLCILFAVALPFVNLSEWVERVEVTGKRIIQSSGGSDSGKTYRYIVAFQLPDGTEKELRVGKINSSKLYNSINDGDTGILTYKEKENVKAESDRRFISFEKDPKYGGLKIETDETSDKTLAIQITSILAFAVILYTAALIVIYKRNIFTLVKKRPELHEQVKVIKKRVVKQVYSLKRYTSATIIVASIVAFKFADG